MEVDNNVLDVVERQQFPQVPDDWNELRFAILPGLIKDACQAGHANRFIRRYPDANCARTVLRRCHRHIPSQASQVAPVLLEVHCRSSLW